MTNVDIQSSISATNPSSHDLPDGPVDASLWRGILLVEPDITLLTAETLLLTHSNYCVTSACSLREIFALRDTKAIALAILSDCLGPHLLTAAAETVRRQWPHARILILGRAESVLEDHLYDEQINHSLDQKQLPDDLERLYKNSWNQRSNTLDWNAKHSGACFDRSWIRESDPTKTQPFGVEVDTNLRDTPSGIKYRAR
jgi:hypothetical protein